MKHLIFAFSYQDVPYEKNKAYSFIINHGILCGIPAAGTILFTFFHLEIAMRFPGQHRIIKAYEFRYASSLYRTKGRQYTVYNRRYMQTFTVNIRLFQIKKPQTNDLSLR